MGSKTQGTQAMDFVHCNACFRLPGGSALFFVGTCSMCILCQKCTTNMKSRPQPNVCIICKKSSNFIKISGDGSMPSNMVPYFRDPKQLSDQFLKQLTHVLDFRNGHRLRLMKARDAQFKRCAVEFKKLQEECKMKHEGERDARQELQHYQEQMKGFKRKLEEDEREMARLRELLKQSHQFTPKRRHIEREPEFFMMNTSEQNTTTSDSMSIDMPRIEMPRMDISRTPEMEKTNLLSIEQRIGDATLSTPAMLGIGRSRSRSKSAKARKNARNGR
uniref:RING-type domain-containing protein n=2 Tax=Steinernema glaseri TaxID=37863 RepID=A0A1I7XVI0_9BILA